MPEVVNYITVVVIDAVAYEGEACDLIVSVAHEMLVSTLCCLQGVVSAFFRSDA